MLRGISLEVQEGEADFLVGASGAGKTTLLYTLAGLERPEAGRSSSKGRLYNGGASAQAKLRNEKMGFVFQGYFLLPELTALENVTLAGNDRRAAGSRRGGGESARVGLASGCIICRRNFPAANNSGWRSRAR